MLTIFMQERKNSNHPKLTLHQIIVEESLYSNKRLEIKSIFKWCV